VTTLPVTAQTTLRTTFSFVDERFNLPIIDLYTVSEENKEFISDDGVHFLEKGYQILANEVLNVVKEYL
jgi:lysophospholipase L1-like esterase